MIYLYLKTHNKTGLKYLGKTEKDPFQYAGSGVYWKKHIKKHGYDVTTKILFESEDINEIRQMGLKLSKELNIVESPTYANLIEENGCGGITSTTWKKGREARIVPEEERQRLSESKKQYWEKWFKLNPNHKDKWKKYIPKGKENWIIIDNITKVNSTIIKCPHCCKEGNVGNMKRWHFDKCKYKV